MQRQRRKWKTNAVALVAIWLALIIASLTILSSVITPFLKTLQTQNLVSLNWGGYGVSSNALFPQPLVTGVSSSWIVPSVAPSSIDTYSAAWIGIGGQTDRTLIQVGTEHDYVDGQASYSMWYEMLPENAEPIENITISPGDRITASISLSNSETSEWHIQILDVTTGKGFNQVFQYNSSRLSAEWIVERPTVNLQTSVLANFGSITFTNASAQVSSKAGTINNFSNYAFVMGTESTQLISLSPLSDGSSFTVTYTP